MPPGTLTGHWRRTPSHCGGNRGVAAAERELVPLAAVLDDAGHADVAAVVVAAGIDAAADVQVDVADVVDLVEVGETFGDLGREGDRACVGKAAEIAARA